MFGYKGESQRKQSAHCEELFFLFFKFTSVEFDGDSVFTESLQILLKSYTHICADQELNF